MDTMAISRETIKALREARAWSQAHLADAAGVSLRTVQRMEAEGTASAETRLAVAAALDVPVDRLNAPAPEAAPFRPGPARIAPGPYDTLLMFAAIGVAELFILSQGGKLPAQVATHFGAAGDPNAYMSRDGFVAWMSVFAATLPLLMWVLLGWAMRRDRLNIPNADYWLAESRRGETRAWLMRHVTWLCVGTTGFIVFTDWLVVAANVAAPGHPVLDQSWFLAGLATFLVAMGAWITTLGLRFRHAPA